MEKTNSSNSTIVASGYPAKLKFTLFLFLVVIIIGSVAIITSWSTNWWSFKLTKSGMENRFRASEWTLPPDHPRARLWFAQDYLDQKRYLEALKMIDPLLQRGDIFALSLKGSVLSATGEDSLAISVLSDAGDVISLGNLARRSTRLGDGYLTYLANKSICEMASDSSEECIAVGKYLIDQGRYPEADEYLKLAISRDPNRRSSYLTRANALRKNGNYSDAIDVYRLALQRFPDFEQVYFEISATYELNDQKQEAVRAIELALITVTNPGQKYLMLAGRIYERGGKPQEALSVYRKVLEIDPENLVAKKAIQRLEKN